jgi:hypothetical protein
MHTSFLVWKPEGTKPVRRSGRKHAWEDIEMDLEETGCEIVDWIRLAQDMDRWRVCALVNKVLSHRVLGGGVFLNHLSNCERLRNDSGAWSWLSLCQHPRLYIRCYWIFSVNILLFIFFFYLDFGWMVSCMLTYLVFCFHFYVWRALFQFRTSLLAIPPRVFSEHVDVTELWSYVLHPHLLKGGKDVDLILSGKWRFSWVHTMQAT